MAQPLKNKAQKAQAFFDAWKLIHQAQKITLLTHFRPDGDGISACAALEHILNKEHKQVETVYPCPAEFDFTWKPNNVLINEHKQIPDLIIICDTANYERAYYPDVFKNIPLINIDHHISNSITGTYNFVNGDLSSTCEGLFLLLNELDQKVIDPYVAECLLSGILYDSQIFQTQAVTPQTLRTAAQLIEYGANLYKLKTDIVANKNPLIIKLWGQIMSSVQITPSGNAIFATVTQKDLKDFGLTLTSLVGFHNFLSQVSTVDITVLLYETENGQTKGSLRSKTTDVNKLAAVFGGGGHINAAGFYSDKPINDVVKMIMDTLNEV